METLLLFAAGFWREIPALGELLPLFLAAQFLAVLAWSALGAFLGQLTSRYMAIALVYGFIVELGIGNIPTNINTLSLMRHLKALLAHNPALFETYEWAGPGRAHRHPGPGARDRPVPGPGHAALHLQRIPSQYRDAEVRRLR